MAKLTKKTTESLLRKPDRFLYLTHAPDCSVYAVNGAGVVPRNVIAQFDLFESPDPKGRLPLIPQEDGLFPGFSQTWRAQ